ncbi:MAG: TRAP transporter large permease subunit [Actinobacteria bacterium]|nr:TRAP transporter large permease subunit [Actinomycetota bacterium]
MVGFGKAGMWLERTIEVAVVVVLLAELAVVFSNVVIRALVGSSYDWVQEISEVSLMFLTFMGGALAYRRGAHMRVHAGINAVPEGARPYVLAAVDTLVCIVAIFLAQQSIVLLAEAGSQLTMSGLPIAWERAPVIIGILLMALFAFGQLFSYPRRVAIPSTVAVVLAVGLLFALTRNAIPADQALVITLILFVIMLAMSAPIGFVFVVISFLYLEQTKLGTLTAIPLKMEYGTSSFVLLAIPFFVLAGLVMTEGGLAIPMSDAIACLIGRLRGGLFQVMVVTMYVFSGISGSKVADMVAVGSSLSAMLKREGYPKGETGAVLASAAAMGETVPPSIAMLVFSSVSTVSVASLFMGGLLPAALIALVLMVAIYFRASRLGIHGAPAIAWKEVARRWAIAIPAFAMPVMLVVGILSGTSTPTEVSTFAVIYGFVMAILVYRKMNGKSLLTAVSDAAIMTGNILFVISAATAFSWALTFFQVPQRLGVMLSVLKGEPWLFMLACAIFMIFMGAFLEGLPAILVLGPILLPIAVQFGITELQMGIVMIIAMGIGFFSPPVGIGIYFACNIAQTTMEEAMKPMMYYLTILIVGLLLVALIPQVSLLLPHLAGMSIQ